MEFQVGKQVLLKVYMVRDMEFQAGEQVLLEVSPIKGVMRFGKKGKLNPQYSGPFEILDSVGPLAYKLALPPSLYGVHQYEEEPIAIFDRDVWRLRTKEIKFVKVQWKHFPVEEATWEVEKDMQDKYPQLFADSGNLQAAIDKPQLGDR
ncbi:uncharacterized protein [Solanum tuberosum]|uniref:uncharacterized protein n=1 Tax=Solanum tuberosum TaxID=4113 RepID=UPI00073A1901|nr:PREDICTED: uncharacterized protein LOC107062826 [Solanum tuberosum]